MSHTTQPSRRSLEPNRGKTSARQLNDSAKRARLWTKLTRQRALLLSSSYVSLTAGGAPELCSDPVDQASTDSDQDLVIQAKIRIMAKLGKIERALQLMRTSDYGRCRRCGEDIPYERLKVQPDALFCVPCLTIVEQDTAGN